jgi:hypothetical protein
MASSPPPPLRLLPAGATSCRVGFAPTRKRRLCHGAPQHLTIPPTGKLWTVIDHNDFRHSTLGRQAVKDPHDPLSKKRTVDLQREALAAAPAYDVERPERAGACQRVAHEIHRSALIEALRADDRLALAATDPLPKPVTYHQALETVEATDPLVVDPVTFPYQ